MYLSEILGGEIGNWQLPGSHVFIEAPTGSGKTSFVLKELRDKAIAMGKPILYLCNRIALKKQFKSRLNKTFLHIKEDALCDIDDLDWFHVTTYQAVAQKMKNILDKRQYWQERNYSYVVCDEFHFFEDDVLFNQDVIYAQRFLQYLQQSTRAPRFVYLSATMGNVPEVYLRCLHVFPHDMKSRKIGETCECCYGDKVFSYRMIVSKRPYLLKFFYNLEDIADLVADTDENEKWLIFISNVEECREKLLPKLTRLNIKYDFVDAATAHSDSQTMNAIRCNEQFESRVLLATKVLDVGVNLHDDSLKNIVITAWDKTTMLQMIGRKRLRNAENVNIFVRSRSGQYFRKLRMLNAELLQLSRLSVVEVWRKYIVEGDDRAKFLIYPNENGILCKNDFYIEKLICNEQFFEDLFNSEQRNMLVEEIFQRYVCEWLHADEFQIIEADYKEKRRSVLMLQALILNEYKELMDAKKQEEFSNVIKNYIQRNGLMDKNLKKGRIMGRSQINKFLAQEEVGLRIVSVRIQREGSRETYWKIEVLND